MTAAEPPRNIQARQSWGLLPKLQDFLFDGRRWELTLETPLLQKVDVKEPSFV
jgi:hypothetical protein